MDKLEWKPIDTCPKEFDVEYIVGFDIATVWITRGAWYNNGYLDPEDIGWWSSRNSVGSELLDDIYTPTHWLCERPKSPRGW